MNKFYVGVVLISFVTTVIFGNYLIPQLKKKHIGQNIREEGPKSHYDKAGTPTMGGIIMILSTIILSILFVPKTINFVILLLSTLGFGLIGFIDDFRKLVMKRSLGLTARQKIILQVLLSFVLILLSYVYLNEESMNLKIPFISHTINLGLLSFPLLMFIIIGTVNAVNLTDGLDGLASSVSIPVFITLIFISQGLSEQLFSSIVVGSILGFLVYNSHPASVFMGDTGSMALGGALASLCLTSGLSIFLIILGGVYMMETLSVIIQVISYRYRNKKRVFLMSPIHHHFELKGHKESKIVTNFAIISTILSLITLLLI